MGAAVCHALQPIWKAASCFAQMLCILCDGLQEVQDAAHHGSFGFIAARVWLPVRPDHAIDAELSIVWEAAKVSSICPVLYSLACSTIQHLL